MSKEELSKQYADKKTSESPRNVYRFLPLEKQKELTCFDGYEIEVAYEDGFDKAMEEIRKEIERQHESIEKRVTVKWAYVDDLLKVTHSVIKISDQEPKTEYVLYGVDGRNPQEDKDTNPFDVEVERWRKEKGADNIRYYECARHFAEWQKQQLMKGVEYVFFTQESWDGSLFKNELRERFKDGDKVKLIIIKENEKVIKS